LIVTEILTAQRQGGVSAEVNHNRDEPHNAANASRARRPASVNALSGG
jgi:hypothetical protein